MNILFACGGTAGHVNPAVGLANLFQKNRDDVHVIFVGAKGGMETRLVPKEGYAIKTVEITNLHRSMKPKDILHNIRTVGYMCKSRYQAGMILNDFPPDLVVGTGGYASYPIVMAAAKRGIPTAVHESNAVPGLTTKALSKVVDCVMVGFPDSVDHYPDAKDVVVTGTPVRGEFFQYTREEARKKLGFAEDDERQLLLSYWGSLGASRMNEKMIDCMKKECFEGAPFLHIHGAGRDYKSMRDTMASKGFVLGEKGIELKEYIYDMGVVMAAADVVLCRAGASTIAEITALKKPSILVPSPNVTANHQEANAKVLADKGAAVMLLEEHCQENTLYQTVEALMRETQRRENMEKALAELAYDDPGEKIYQTLLSLL
ncbi:MAG: UDP-N-acetylglucosamine--N-acetylmuramyl-(pentapeptide) pyrophosphoryl-undecaprenol N-acetylglucosamine transferase [Eubacteriales bacterium]